jgi:hypothetical protein
MDIELFQNTVFSRTRAMREAQEMVLMKTVEVCKVHLLCVCYLNFGLMTGLVRNNFMSVRCGSTAVLQTIKLLARECCEEHLVMFVCVTDGYVECTLLCLSETLFVFCCI